MRDRKLVALVTLATIFSLGHTADHVVRGDVRWPLTAASVSFIGLSLAIYAIVVVGLALYSRGHVGPRFWAIFAGVGAVFGWLAHFSPFTDQPPGYIVGAYRSVSAAWLALSTLIALMVVLVVTTVYAGYLGTTRRSLDARARPPS